MQGYRLDLSNTRMKSRTVSEHTLKGDGGGIEDSVIPSKDSAGDIMDTSSEVSSTTCIWVYTWCFQYSH